MPLTRRCVAVVLSTVVLSALSAALLSPRVPLRWAALRSQLRDASGAAAAGSAAAAPDARGAATAAGTAVHGGRLRRVTRVTAAAGTAGAAGSAGDLRLVWAAARDDTGGAAPSPMFALREEGSGEPLFGTGDSYRACVSQGGGRKRRMLLIGDSILRYTYLALLREYEGTAGRALVRPSANLFLTRHSTAEPTVDAAAAAGNSSGSNNPLWQKEWSGWDDFLHGTTRSFGGRMCCDCSRAPQPPARRPQKEHRRFWRRQRENRHYDTRAGGGGLSASFFFMHGAHGGGGGDEGGAEEAVRGGCRGSIGGPEGAHGYHEAWRGLIPDLARHLQGRNRSYDVIVFNAGLWHPKFMADRGHVAAILAGLEGLRAGPSAALVWASTTHACLGGTRHSEDAVPRFLAERGEEAGWRHLDLLSLTRELATGALGVPRDAVEGRVGVDVWANGSEALRERCSTAYVDTIGHFQPYIYTEVARALVRLSCAVEG